LISTNVYKLVSTVILLILFTLFLIFNIILHSSKHVHQSHCGCFGKYVRRKNFNIGIRTSLIQLLLALLLVVLSLWESPLSWMYYLFSAFLYVVVLGWLAWRTWQRHHQFAIAGEITFPTASPPPGKSRFDGFTWDYPTYLQGRKD